MTKEEILNFLADLVANKEREANKVETRSESQGLLICPDCHGIVSQRAQVCPHCGCPIELIAIANRKQEKKENALSQKATTTEALKIEAQQDCSVTPKGQKPDTKKQVFTLPEMERAKNINSLLGARVRNFDDGHEGVIESIGDNSWVHVRGEKYFKGESIYKFLGHFKFLNPQDKVIFKSIFGQEIENYKAREAKAYEETAKLRESKNKNLDYNEPYYYDEEESDSGPDDIADTYWEYHRYD